MDNEYKNLKVKADTHQAVKMEAVAAGKTIDDFLSDIIAEWRHLTNLQAALGKRPEREQEYEDPGGHG